MCLETTLLCWAIKIGVTLLCLNMVMFSLLLCKAIKIVITLYAYIQAMWNTDLLIINDLMSFRNEHLQLFQSATALYSDTCAERPYMHRALGKHTNGCWNIGASKHRGVETWCVGTCV